MTTADNLVIQTWYSLDLDTNQDAVFDGSCWRPVEHPGTVILHFCFLEIKVFCLKMFFNNFNQARDIFMKHRKICILEQAEIGLHLVLINGIFGHFQKVRFKLISSLYFL